LFIYLFIGCNSELQLSRSYVISDDDSNFFLHILLTTVKAGESNPLNEVSGCNTESCDVYVPQFVVRNYPVISRSALYNVCSW